MGWRRWECLPDACEGFPQYSAGCYPEEDLLKCSELQPGEHAEQTRTRVTPHASCPMLVSLLGVHRGLLQGSGNWCGGSNRTGQWMLLSAVAKDWSPWEVRPCLSLRRPPPRCPLSARLQVLVCEHVEFTVQPASFIPEQFGFALK